MRSWCCLPSLKQREGVVSISLWLSSVGYNYFLSQFIPVRSCSAPLPLHILLLMGLLAQTTQLRWENNLFADQLHHHSQDLLPLWRITPQILQKCHRPKIYQWLQMGGGVYACKGLKCHTTPGIVQTLPSTWGITPHTVTALWVAHTFSPSSSSIKQSRFN